MMSRTTALGFSKQTLLNILYLLLSFPLGIAYFVILVTGFAVGIGLLPILWGIPVLALTMAVWWYLGAFERLQAIRLLGVDVKPMRGDSFAGLREWQKVVAHLKNPVTWTSLIYLLLKFPFGIVAFVVLVVGSTVSASLIGSPVIYWFVDSNVVNSDLDFALDSFGEAILAAGLGLFIALPLTILAITGLAVGWKHFSALMLGDHRQPQDEPEEPTPPVDEDGPAEPELPGTAPTDPTLPMLAP